ncbi:Glycosidase [Pseudobutyrivibrio sp. YE44]|uniref:glycoside hydrolase family 13 protein n=1 Tax=Pseudobutyrivibrio sp. YE44 TaxID=1520802 RepID=UPI00088302F0|nr:glycoside hydrolase family 13 protein [Pseudobutyrivibrio sp. YE44]SDB29464.1 Glycosidase [Pseudobutyrivibrio sp. YE44]
MNLAGITHRPLSEQAYMTAEDRLVISLKSAKGDLKKASLFFGDRVDLEKKMRVTKVEMELVATDEIFDYFEAEVKTNHTRVCYYFYLEDNYGIKLYYDEYGFAEEVRENRTQYFQFPYLRREDMITMPDWTKNMVMYHIFPDSFADGKRSISCQGKTLTEGDVEYRSNLGGNLKGIVENLDYISELGTNCIYINPIFKANSYHKYDTVDYMDIDPCFGTLEDFKELVKQCHARDIKVILDGVFNHCGPDFFAFKDVLEKGEKSEYVDWFYKLRFPIQRNPYPNYEAFAYVSNMPKLNTGNPKVQEYCCEVGRFWIRECGIDGWRMDVANEINHEFFRAFKRAIREENPESFLIGEIWEDSTVWLQGDQFDSTMNYTFTNICRDFFAEEKIGIKEFDERIQHMLHRYPNQVTLAQMNFLDTHDVGRFLSFCKGDERKLKLALAFMMCAPGIPSVFYGDEKGMEGLKECEYRKPMPWDKTTEIEEFYRKWIHIRRNSKALSQGSYRTELVDENNKLYCFSRTYGQETVKVTMNLATYEIVIS